MYHNVASLSNITRRLLRHTQNIFSLSTGNRPHTSRNSSGTTPLPPHTHQDHPADSLPPPPPTPSRWTAQKTSYTRQFDSNHTDGRDSAILASTASTGCFSLFLLHFFFLSNTRQKKKKWENLNSRGKIWLKL